MPRTRRSERTEIVASACQQFPEAANASLARRLAKQHPALFPSPESARNAIRSHVGSLGAAKRRRAEQRGTARPHRPAGKLPALPRSLSRPWMPYTLDAKRTLILSDIHIPFHDRPALAAALRYGDSYDPDCVLLNGDVLDFQAISKFARDPRGPTIAQELKLARKFFRHLRQRFPKAKIVFKLGNHEERYARFLWSRAPELLDVAEFSWHQVAGLPENDIEVVEDQRIILLGKLPVLHGHELPKGITNPVNPARGAFLRALDCVLVGHFHRTSDHTERTMLGRVIAVRSTGCLCHLAPEYARVNRWDHGFATVSVKPSGNYDCTLKRIIDGKTY